MSNSKWTHIYGLLSVVSIIIGLISYKEEWGSNLWMISGWILALGYASVTFKLIHASRNDTEELGATKKTIAKLEEQLKNQEISYKEKIDALTNTANYLASLQMGKQAIPRQDNLKN